MIMHEFKGYNASFFLEKCHGRLKPLHFSFTDEGNAGRMSSVSEFPWGLLVRPIILSHQQFIGADSLASFTLHSSLQWLFTHLTLKSNLFAFTRTSCQMEY